MKSKTLRLLLMHRLDNQQSKDRKTSVTLPSGGCFFRCGPSYGFP